MTTCRINLWVATPCRCRSSRRCGLLLCLIPLAAASIARAQVALEVEEAAVVVDAGFQMSESNFDQWIFGSNYADRGRKRVESLLALKLDAIHRICRLREDQTVKLHLAGQGDIKRFYDDVQVARDNFMKVRHNRNAVNNIWREVQPLQTTLNAGLFGPNSFFQKVLNRALDDEQAAKFEAFEEQRWQFRHNARLTLVIGMLERTVPLRAKQRERFVAVLEQETEPVRVTGQYDYYVALYQMSKVPAQKLKPIFDEAQWKVVQKFLAQGLAMEHWLKQQQVLP